MPLLDCANPAVAKTMVKPDNCLTRVIVSQLAFAAFKDVASFTDSAEEITAVAMSGGAFFQPIESVALNAALTVSLAEDTGIYTSTLTVDFGGFSKEIRDAVLHAQSLCNLVFWIGLNNCSQRIMGIDKVGTEWKATIDSKVTGHEETMGGQSDASNVITFTSRTFTSPPFTTIDYATLPTPV